MFWLTFGMIKRLFMLVFLYVVSPVLCAMYPLDGGTAVGGWKKQFISNTISAYGAVAGMNLFFSIAPLIQNIELSSATMPGTSAELVNSLGIISLLLTIAGLYVVKDFVSLINGYIGANDAMNDGKGLWSSVKDRVKGVRDKAGAKVSGAFAWMKRRHGRQKFFDEQVKSGAMTQEKARKELRRQELKDLADFGKKNINKGLKFLTGIDRDKYKDSTDEGYNKADSEFRKRAAKEERDNILDAINEGVARRSELNAKASAGTITSKETDELAEINKNLEDLLDKADKLGIKDAILSVTGKSPEVYKNYKDAKKDLDDANNALNKKTEQLNMILNANDADFKSRYNSGNLYTSAEISAAATDEIKQSMIRANEQLQRAWSIRDDISDTAKGYDKKVAKYYEARNILNPAKTDAEKEARQKDADNFVKTVEDLKTSTKSGDTAAAATQTAQLKHQNDMSKNYDKMLNQQLIQAVSSKLDDIKKEIKRNEKKNDKK